MKLKPVSFFFTLSLGVFFVLWLGLPRFEAVAAPNACAAGPHHGAITTSQTWCLSDSPHIVDDQVTVASGATLTIEPGVVVRIAPSFSLLINGDLQAVGTTAQPITFTSQDDVPADEWGHWSGIGIVNGTAHLKNVIVQYAGRDGNPGLPAYTGAGIAVKNSSGVVIEDSQVLYTASICWSGCHNPDFGLYADSSKVTVTNTHFEHNGDGLSDNANLTDAPVYLTGDISQVDLQANVIQNNQLLNVVKIGASASMAASMRLAPQTTWQGYLFDGAFTVPTGLTLTLEPGVIARVAPSFSLSINGDLQAVGTTAQPITFTSQSDVPADGWGHWDGIGITNGTAHFKNAIIQYAGRDGNPSAPAYTGVGILVKNSGGVVIEDSQVLSTVGICWNGCSVPDFGLYADSSKVTVTNTRFANNGDGQSNNDSLADAPVYLTGDISQVDLQNNVLESNTPQNVIAIANGATLSASTRLTVQAAGDGYRFNGGITVPAGLTLTLDPGLVARFAPHYPLWVNGDLEAVGTATQPVVLTSLNDAAPNLSDHWNGIAVQGSAAQVHLFNAIVRYAGYGSSLAPYTGTALAVKDVHPGSVVVEDSQIVSTIGCNDYGGPENDYALYVENSLVTVTNTLFKDNGDDPGYIDYPMVVDGAASAVTWEGNTFQNNALNVVFLRNQALTGANFSLPWQNGLDAYQLKDKFTVPAGITMTVEAGVATIFDSASSLYVQGRLEADGTSIQPVSFMAINHAPSSWTGIVFSGGTGSLSYATIRYSNEQTVDIENVTSGEVSLDHCQIMDSYSTREAWGYYDTALYISNSNVTVSDSLFQNNNNSAYDQVIGVFGTSNVTLRHNTITQNTGNSIVVQGGTLLVSANLIQNNPGIFAQAADSLTLENNALVDVAGDGLVIGSGVTQAHLNHNTFTRATGSAIHLGSNASVTAENTLLAQNKIGVNVDLNGHAAFGATLWDRNTTDKGGVGALTETHHKDGTAGLAADGYHLTRFSAALGAGVVTSLATDIDGDARPLPAGSLPDLGADESAETLADVNSFLAEETAFSPKVVYKDAGFTIQQDYLVRYYYGSSLTNPPALDVAVSDTLPAGLQYQSQSSSPAMTFQHRGQKLQWQTVQPLGQSNPGDIYISTSGNPTAKSVLVNPVTLDAGSFHFDLQAQSTMPFVPPLITFPGNGEICPEANLQVNGVSQSGMKLHLLENNLEVGALAAGSDGKFSFSYPSTHAGKDANTAIQVKACLPSDPSQCASSSVVHLTPNRFTYCPQRSTWEGTVKGQHVVYQFRDRNGNYTSRDWVIPGVLGFSNTVLHLHGCRCPASSGVTGAPAWTRVVADGIVYESTTAYPNYTFNITGYAHVVQIWSMCGAKEIDSNGNILIDPDGYVYDQTQGFDPASPSQHALANATVTAYVYLPDWGGWVVWPASLYNNQENPQVTDASGYFAFLTPPGKYYLQVTGPDGFQTWRSPVIEVTDQLVHANVPLTPTLGAAARVVRLPLASQGTVTRVPTGTTVEWQFTPGPEYAPDQWVQWTENPAFRLLSDLDPAGQVLGWDSGMLVPGQAYRRQFTTPGTYTYSDGQGHTATIIVADMHSTFLPALRR